ncbi:hypothetical protein KCV03_g10266, partial [Aureobasidium melanogenum]
MSNLFSKLTEQMSSSQKSQQSSSGGLVHKLTDAVTGSKHPQDSQGQSSLFNNQQRPNPGSQEGGYGEHQQPQYGASYGGGYAQGGYGGHQQYDGHEQGGRGGHQQDGHGGHQQGGYGGHQQGGYGGHQQGGYGGHQQGGYGGHQQGG